MNTGPNFHSTPPQEPAPSLMGDEERLLLEAQTHYAQACETVLRVAEEKGSDSLKEIAQNAGLPMAAMQGFLERLAGKSNTNSLEVQKEVCHFCQHPLLAYEREKAVCLQCLQALAQVLPTSSVVANVSTETSQTDTAVASAGSFAAGMVPMEMFLKLQKELIRYQLKFGVLPDGDDLTASLTETKGQEAPTQSQVLSQGAMDVVSAEKNSTSLLPAEAEDAANLLEILNLDDRSVKQTMNDLSSFMKEMDLVNQEHEPLRHFGFLRPKSYQSH